MIELVVEEYCHNDCTEFEADVIGPTRTYTPYGEPVGVTSTIVQCSHRNLCRQLKQYLEKGMKTDER